jgi:hypothetical protein
MRIIIVFLMLGCDTICDKLVMGSGEPYNLAQLSSMQALSFEKSYERPVAQGS